MPGNYPEESIQQEYVKIMLAIIHILLYLYIFFLLWRCDPTRVMASSFTRFS